jgi:hypothetical protein
VPAAFPEIVAAPAQLAGHPLERAMRVALAGYAAQKVVPAPADTISHRFRTYPRGPPANRPPIDLGEDG